MNGRAQQADLNEIVEMPGLERSILAIVGEAQQFACLPFQALIAPQGTNGGQTQYSRGRAPSSGSESCQFPII